MGLTAGAAPYRVVRATKEERSFIEIAALDKVAWRDASGNYRHDEDHSDGEHAWRLWTEHAVVYNALLLEDDEQNPAGTLIGTVLSFPCMPTEPNQVVTLYCLHKVMVDNTYRGHGVGAALMEACLLETDRLGADSFLTVNPKNQAAINLYMSWGFEVTEESLVKGYYEAAESGDRLVIVRPRNAKRQPVPKL